MRENPFDDFPIIPFFGSTNARKWREKWEPQILEWRDNAEKWDKLQSSENTPVELRVIPHDEAKKLIEDYITDNHGVWTSDIAFNLGLDVGLVLGILRELTQEGSIHPTEITEEDVDNRRTNEVVNT